MNRKKIQSIKIPLQAIAAGFFLFVQNQELWAQIIKQ